MMLRRIFGLERDEVTKDQGKFHENLHNLNSSPSIIRIITPRRIKRPRYCCAWRRDNESLRA
jgi:hypothetical protein